MGDGLFGFQGAFVSVCSKIFDTLVLGLLWIVCSLPVITIGASSTALYYAIVKCVKNDDGYAVREYFKCFRREFKQATILWIILAAVYVLMRLNTGILMAKTDGLFGFIMIGVYTVVCIYVALMACYIFPALSRFEMPTGWFIKIGIFMSIRYFLTSIAIVLIFVSFAGFLMKLPILFFIVPGPIAFLISEFMERVLKKHAPKTREAEESAPAEDVAKDAAKEIES